MVKEKVEKGAKAVKADPSLSADVLKFASSLGLVSGAGGDNAFDDFDPKKAKASIGKQSAAEGKNKSDAKGGRKDLSDRKKRDKDVAPAPAGILSKKEGGEGKAKTREWNFGVGPRPGVIIALHVAFIVHGQMGFI